MRIDLTNEDMKTLLNISEISKSRIKQILRRENNNIWGYLKDKIKEER